MPPYCSGLLSRRMPSRPCTLLPGLLLLLLLVLLVLLPRLPTLIVPFKLLPWPPRQELLSASALAGAEN